MSAAIGASINDVLSEADLRPGGKGMTPGVLVTTYNGSVFMCVKGVAGQNVVNGNVIYVDGSYNATIMGSGPPTPSGAAAANILGIAVCSVTASASQLFFAQVFGPGNVRVTDTTASNLPGHTLTMGSVPGEVKGGAATASGYISGLVLTATASVATLSACFISYPRLAIG